MLRTNLATRPFYNERAVHVVLGGIALAAALVLVASGIRLSVLFQERATLTAAAESNERQAEEVLDQAVELQRQAGTTERELLVAASREANRLIDQRVFSWTDFLNRIEATLPDEVMLTSLRPDVAERVVGVQVGIVSQSVGAIDQLIEQLERTGAFVDVLSREEEITDDGFYRAVLYGRYVPVPAEGNETGVPPGVTQ